MAAGTGRRRGRPTLMLCALASAALAVAGCGAIGDRLGNATATDVVSRTLEVTGVPSLAVETFNGRVSVLAGSGASVVVTVERRGSGRDDAAARADLQKVDVTIEASGSTVTVRARRSDDRNHSGNSGADVTVTLPAAASLDLRSSNGEITTTGITGPVRIATSNAAVTVSGATSGIDATTSNGAITATGATGGVTASTSSGEIDVRGASGVVDARTSNGQVRIEATAATVHAHTSNGRLTFTGQLASGAHEFETSNGDVELTLPPDAAFSLDARTTGAEVTSEFPVTGISGESRGTLAGTVGGSSPATSISVTTSNASIRLHRSR